MKTTCGLAAAAVFAAFAIVSTGAFSHERNRPEPERGGAETHSTLYEMRASLLDIWDGRTGISGDWSSVSAIPEPLLLRGDRTAPGLGVTPEPTPELGSSVFSTSNATEKTEPAPIPQTDPLPAPPIPQIDPQTDAVARFVQGWAAGGGAAVSVRLVLCIQGFESGGDPLAYNPAGPFYGLMQFLGSTWDAMGGGDWRDPYVQGRNTARLWYRAPPSTQWPIAYQLCTS